MIGNGQRDYKPQVKRTSSLFHRGLVTVLDALLIDINKKNRVHACKHTSSESLLSPDLLSTSPPKTSSRLLHRTLHLAQRLAQVMCNSLLSWKSSSIQLFATFWMGSMWSCTACNSKSIIYERLHCELEKRNRGVPFHCWWQQLCWNADPIKFTAYDPNWQSQTVQLY